MGRHFLCTCWIFSECCAFPAVAGAPFLGLSCVVASYGGMGEAPMGACVPEASVFPRSILVPTSCSTYVVLLAPPTAWDGTDVPPTSEDQGRYGQDAVVRIVTRNSRATNVLDIIR